MSEIKVNKISPRAACGTVTLGDSGDTFTIPAGATITNAGTANGFGATGAVNWQTTVKTTNFTAVAGEGYFVNTTSGAISVNLPAGTAGAVVGFKDYAKTFDTAALTLVQNGSDKIGGSTTNATINTEGIAITLVFVDSTQGWLVTDDGLQSRAVTATYIAASGGTEVTCGDFKYHKFTGPGNFCVSAVGNACGSNTVQALVIAGGGGAAGNSSGGGGAGGLRNVACTPVSVQSYPISIGGGGTGGGSPNPPCITNGTNSVAVGLTSAGGGAGGVATNTSPAPVNQAGKNGGSGGGGVGNNRCSPGGTGNTPPVNPAQGTDGATTSPSSPNTYTGGGGGGGAGGAAPPKAGPGATPGGPRANGGDGGAALNVTPSFPSPAGGGTYAGGGAGGVSRDGPSGPSSTVGSVTGGAGTCAGAGSSGGQNATANTGSGGGAGGTCSTSGGNGGSGLVIIKYKFQN